MASELQGITLSTGHQSEPTTPPEYRDHVFPSVYSRRNRYSSSSLVSPPGINNRLSRSGSQLVSPLPEQIQTEALDNADKLPSKSVPGSRRGSTDRVSSYLPESSASSQRSAKYVKPILNEPVLVVDVCVLCGEYEQLCFKLLFTTCSCFWNNDSCFRKIGSFRLIVYSLIHCLLVEWRLRMHNQFTSAA